MWCKQMSISVWQPLAQSVSNLAVFLSVHYSSLDHPGDASALNIWLILATLSTYSAHISCCVQELLHIEECYVQPMP